MQGYLHYVLSLGGKRTVCKAHRLVAMLFLDNPKNEKVVNHIDGNKLNNHYENLEWCSHYHNNKHAREMGLNDVSLSNKLRWSNEEFRNRTSRNISEGIRASGCNVGRNNPNSRYIVTKDGNEISRQELASICGVAMSTSDAYIRKSSQGKKVKIFLKNNINVIDTKKGLSTNESVA